MLERQLAEIDAAIAKEHDGIADGVRQSREMKVSMHNDYWHRLYRLREQRRALLAVRSAFESVGEWLDG